MKLVILVVVVLLVLGLGGGAAYVTLFAFAEAPPAAEEAPKPDPAAYADLDVGPLLVPLTSSRLAALGVKMTLVDKDAVAQATARMPRLRDAFLSELYAAADKGGFAAGVRDFGTIEPRLLEKARGILGPESVVGVALGDASLAPPPEKKPEPAAKSH